MVDTQAYGLMLEELLQRLRQEIDSYSQLESVPGVTEADQYLLHINSFYYQSFLERYLPQYQQGWYEEVRKLLLLSQQQQVLETNIMSTLKRYTRLHNLLKTLLASIEAFYHLNHQEAGLIQEETLRQGTELLLALTDLERQLQSLQAYLTAVGPYVEDAELMKALREYPGCAAVWNVEADNSPGAAVGSHRLSQAISEIGYMMALLQSSIIADQAGRARIGEDMRQRIEQLGGSMDSADPVSEWIGRQLSEELSLYRAALLAEPFSAQIPTHLLRRLQGWHKVLQLQASKGFSASAQLQSLLFLCRTSPDSIQEYRRDVEFSWQQLNQIIAVLQRNPDPSYQVLVQVREWLAFWSPFLRSMSGEAEVRQVPHLHALLHQARVGISFLSGQLGMIETARRRSAYNQDQVERMRTLAEAQLAFLRQLKADLDRLLAPRNIARTWKDMGVRLFKLPLQKGQVFPPEHVQLLEQARWEARPDAARPDYTILHEEGDLFIIQVLNEEQLEIPFMILTRQPPAGEG